MGRPTLAAAAFATVLLAGAFWLLVSPGGSGRSQDVPIGGPFELIAEDGSKLTDRDLVGRPFAIYFGFTYCPDVCPTSMLEMSGLLADLGGRATDFRVYFVSVDPERDTPEALRAYTDSFDPRIVGLTGSPAAIASIAAAYRVFYRKVPAGTSYTMDHTATVYLMDARGRFFGTIAYQEPKASALAKLQRLLESRS